MKTRASHFRARIDICLQNKREMSRKSKRDPLNIENLWKTDGKIVEIDERVNAEFAKRAYVSEIEMIHVHSTILFNTNISFDQKHYDFHKRT